MDTSSQHNKISPIVNNAPFEQTFRVTVYLPKNQLYVERIGAKTKLSTLMDKIAENKHLTADKYEFRHPGDMSQSFNFDKTIGEVGLNELKLVLKTESRFNSDFHRFHADDMMKYKSSVPDSVSSSEISRNYGKNALQKASPYSSTTSLNSLDSTGMNLTAKMQPPVAPVRKKRAAPRPPSQNSIPEQEIFGTALYVFKEPHSILPRKNFHVSSPQLFHNNQPDGQSDKNNNIETGNRLNAITRPTSLYVTSTTEIHQNGSAGHQRSPSESSEIQNILHERQNSSNSLGEFSPRFISFNIQFQPSQFQRKRKSQRPFHRSAFTSPFHLHGRFRTTPSHRQLRKSRSRKFRRRVQVRNPRKLRQRKFLKRFRFLGDKEHGNVSKTMLNNVAPSGELPSSEASDGPISIQIISSDNSIEHVKEEATSSPKLPAVSKVHIKLEDERRSSSEEDEMTVNIYNVTKSVVTLEKQSQVTITASNGDDATREDKKEEKKSEIEVQQPIKVVKEVPVEPKLVKEDSLEGKVLRNVPMVVEARNEAPRVVKVEKEAPKEEKVVAEAPAAVEVKREEIENRPLSPLWTYTLPAPPVFADSGMIDKASPTDRQKPGDKFFSDFASTDCNETVLSDSNTTVVSTETHIQPIIVERKSREESFMMTSTEYTKKVVVDGESDKNTEIITSDVEDGYLGNGKMVTVDAPIAATENHRKIAVDDFKRSRLIISRSDSFHSIGQARNLDSGYKRGPLSPPQRSSSFLSLVQAQKAEILSNKSSTDNVPYSRQKSTSELSISDSPSLQSLEVIKNILNSSRKNSLPEAALKEEKSQQSFMIREEREVKKPERKPAVQQQQSFIIKEEREVKPAIVQQQSIEIKIEREVKKPERHVSDSVVETKPVETQWRYSGPPKINLGTWNERPSTKVAIAADSDYKFGGVSATLPRDFKNLQEATSKRHTIHITDERVEKVEAVKPRVLGVEYKKDVSPVVLRDSTAEIVTKPTRTIINIKPRPMSMDTNNVYSSVVTSSSNSSVSYNRLNSNAKKFTPVVHGFKLNNINEADQVDSTPIPVAKKVEKRSMEPPSVPTKPNYLRSTSSGDIHKKTIVEHESSSPDFSSVDTGLRKTGLKEKILVQDKATKSIFGKVIDTRHDPIIRYNDQHQVVKTTFRQMSQPLPTPPKPPPTNFRKSAPIGMDTRDQLLDAIKNFNRDSLRHK